MRRLLFIAGGLTAAALAARDGLDVLVAEGHTRPGGCAEYVAVEQCLEHGGVGLKSGGHDESGLFPFELRDFGFDWSKQVEIAGDET